MCKNLGGHIDIFQYNKLNEKSQGALLPPWPCTDCRGEARLRQGNPRLPSELKRLGLDLDYPMKGYRVVRRNLPNKFRILTPFLHDLELYPLQDLALALQTYELIFDLTRNSFLGVERHGLLIYCGVDCGICVCGSSPSSPSFSFSF